MGNRIANLRKSARRLNGSVSLIFTVYKGDQEIRSEWRWAIASLVTASIGVLALGAAGYLTVGGIATIVGAGVTVFTGHKAYVGGRKKFDLQKPDIVAKTRPVSGMRRFSSRIEFSDILPSLEEEALGLRADHDPEIADDAFVRSERYDNRLMAAGEISCVEQRSRKWSFFDRDSDTRQRQLQYLWSRVIQSKIPTTNESKIGLVMDETEPPAGIQLYKVGYFDSLLTNEAFRSEIYFENTAHGGELEDIVDLTRSFPAYQDLASANANTARLKRLREAGVGNHIGATTITVTADRRLLFFRQAETVLGKGTLLLGGSGSVDWGDIRHCAKPSDLRSILAFGMAREMIEESGASAPYRKKLKIWTRKNQVRHAAESTLVTGYFRWVNRCGKPEFVGVTRTPLAYSDFVGDNFEVRHFKTEVPILTCMGDFRPIHKKLIVMLKDQRLKLGLSTHVALLRLVEISTYRNCGDPLKEQVYDQVAQLLNLER